MATVKALLWRVSDGTGAIAIRITVDRKRSYKYLGYRMEEVHWDPSKGLVKKTHPNHLVLNQLIKTRVNEVENILIKKDFNNEKVSAKSLKNDSFDKKASADSFYVFAEEYLQACKRRQPYSDGARYSAETIKTFTGDLNKAKAFKMSLTFREINVNFISQFQSYMERTLGNANNTVWKTLKSLRRLTNVAIDKGLMSNNPFVGYKGPTYQQTIRQFLTEEERDSLYDFIIGTPTIPVSLRDTGLWFLLSCYAGFRYSDLKDFDEDKLTKGDRLVLLTGKMGTVVSIPKQGKILTILKLLKDRPPIFVNQTCNRYLKLIREMAGIEVNLTFHVSRHTFGAGLASSGVSKDLAQAFLGHSSIKFTSIYYHLTDSRMDEEFAKFMK